IVNSEITLLIDLDRIVGMWEMATRPDSLALPARTRTRILIVEDTRFFQKLIAEHLQSAGYEVKVVENGQEALAILRKEKFELVVSDIEMPVMNGHALARGIRSDARLARMPLLALTTLNTTESRAEAIESGFDAYQIKLDRQQLLGVVGDLLVRARQ